VPFADQLPDATAWVTAVIDAEVIFALFVPLCVWSLSAWTLSSSAGKKTEPLSPVTGLTKP
jgi:hypothetical protein